MSEQSELPNVEALQKMLSEIAAIEAGAPPPKRVWTIDDLAEQIASLDRRMMQMQVTIDMILHLVKLL